jgi:integral membrane protein
MTQLTLFRRLSIFEGASLLILLFIAMPIKYIGGNPLPVRYVGMIHGVLFMVYIVQLFVTALEYRWSKKFTLIAFICASIPFGMIFLDKRLKALET